MMAIALKSSNYQIVPYHALELPLKKVGHPYTADMPIRDNKSDKSSSMSCSDDVDSVDEVAPIQGRRNRSGWSGFSRTTFP